MYYQGNVCGLIAVRRLRTYDDAHVSHPDEKEEREESYKLLEEEIVQLRTFINTHHPENNLPTSLEQRHTWGPEPDYV
jgi:hypothetical protein